MAFYDFFLKLESEYYFFIIFAVADRFAEAPVWGNVGWEALT